MKRSIYLLAITNVLALAMFFVMAATIHDRPNSYWWSGNEPGDTAWAWMKTVDGMVMGGKGTGKIWYVDSNVSNEGDGRSMTAAKDTLNEAVDAIYADGGTNRGDYIYIAQGHTETLGAAADEVDLDVAGITVIGCGNGTLRPLFDYTADWTGAFAVGAANIRISNCVFKANVPDVNEAIEVEAAGDYLTVEYCDFIVETAGTDEFANAIKLGDAADFCTIKGCMFDSQAGAAVSAIFMDYDTEGMVIRDNHIRGDYSTACIVGDTTLSTNIVIRDNTLWNGVTANLGTVETIELLTGTVGIISDNLVACNVATVDVSMVGDSVYLFGNWYNEDAGIDKTAVRWHVYDANDTIASSVTVSGDG